MIEINLDQLNQLQKMLEGGDDDYEIAISNIINLNLNQVYIKLISKNIKPQRRGRFLNAFQIKGDMTFNGIYNDISIDNTLIESEVLKQYYASTIEVFITNAINALDVPLNKLKVESTWPCKQQ
jgi:hypothetical protein